jgi:hypothetical protein
MGHGLSRDAAVGVTCPLWYESKLNPGSQGSQSSERGGILNAMGAFGVASWNGTRQADLLAFSQKKNLPVDSLETQLWFVLNEAANKYPKTWAAITGAGTYEEIIPVFVADYENPADHAKEIAAALEFAKELYPLVPTEAPTAATPPAQAPTLPPPATSPSPASPGAPEPPWPTPILPHQIDSEIAIMEQAYEIIAGLPAAAQHRVLVYLYSRFNP